MHLTHGSCTCVLGSLNSAVSTCTPYPQFCSSPSDLACWGLCHSIGPSRRLASSPTLLRHPDHLTRWCTPAAVRHVLTPRLTPILPFTRFALRPNPFLGLVHRATRTHFTHITCSLNPCSALGTCCSSRSLFLRPHGSSALMLHAHCWVPVSHR